MAGGCNGSHWAGDLHTCHDIPQLRELNDEQALTLLPVTIYLGLLMVLGICGNLLVWYVYYFRFKKTPSNYFVLCLATLDLLTCIFAAPFEIYDVAKPLMFDMPIACKTMRFLETVTTVASGITLVAVAWDRYRKVFKPFQRISNKRAKILTYIAVAIGVFFAWPTFFINGSKHVRTKEPNITGISCSTSDSVRSTVYPKLYSAFLLLLFFVSVGFLIVFYSKVGLEIRKRGNMRLSQTPTAFQYNDTSLSMEPGDEESSSGGQRPSSARDTRKKYNIPLPTSPSTPKTASKFSNLKSPTNPKSPTDLNQSIAARAGYNPGKTTLILFCVSVAFVLSFLPYVIVKIIQAANSGFDMFPNDSSFVAYNFATRSFLINAAVNPIIYSCLNDAFRKECKALAQKCFTRCKRCQSCRRDL